MNEGRSFYKANQMLPSLPGRAIVRVERTTLHDAPGQNRIPFKLDASIYLGNHWEYRLSAPGVALKAKGAVRREPGQVWCQLPANDVWIFAETH